MQWLRPILFVTLVVLLAGAAILAARALGWLTDDSGTSVKPLPPGDHEIAFIEPATSNEEWERIVSAVTKLLEKPPPALVGYKRHADGTFPPRTADTPELAVSAPGSRGKLWIRWYKIGGENTVETWLDRLRERARPPLAILGGATSDRAARLARKLATLREGLWRPAPLFLITTATAEEYKFDTTKNLIDVYSGRSFRFSFTNPHMVKSLLDFVESHPDVWNHKGADADAAIAKVLPKAMYTLDWEDDAYSRDLKSLFEHAFTSRHPEAPFFHFRTVPTSIGEFIQPNPDEQSVITTWLAAEASIPKHTLLVLPTGAQRMRRFLGALARQAPLDVRNLVVLNGDAISFHTVYRDRYTAWNIRDIPVSMVFFAHRNPVDAGMGFSQTRDEAAGKSRTGTHDVLLYRDVLETLLHAAFPENTLDMDVEAILQRIQHTQWIDAAGERGPHVGPCDDPERREPTRPLFDGRGDRSPRTGEHLIHLKPLYEGDRVGLRSRLVVWEAVPGQGQQLAWRIREKFEELDYAGR